MKTKTYGATEIVIFKFEETKVNCKSEKHSFFPGLSRDRKFKTITRCETRLHVNWFISKQLMDSSEIQKIFEHM